MGLTLLYPSSEGFLMIRIQNVSGKAVLMCLIPILVGLYLMALSALRPPLRVLAPINEVTDVLIHIRFSIFQRYKECA